jgi:hypothetical protein
MNELKRAIKSAMTAETTPSLVEGSTVTTIEYNKHSDVIKGRVSTVRETTHSCVPTLSWTVMEHGANGRRTIYTLWIGTAFGQPTEYEAGTVTARTVRGNPRGSTFKVLVENHVVEIDGMLDDFCVVDTENGLRLI